MVKWVLGEAEAKEPEFSNAWPGKDTPGFVSLQDLSASQYLVVVGSLKAYYSVDVVLDVFWCELGILLE